MWCYPVFQTFLFACISWLNVLHTLWSPKPCDLTFSHIGKSNSKERKALQVLLLARTLSLPLTSQTSLLGPRRTLGALTTLTGELSFRNHINIPVTLLLSLRVRVTLKENY